MRALVVLLLLANLGWLALARGWLQPWAGLSSAYEREPQRLAAQVNADAVRVLQAAPASPEPATSPCLQAGPFDGAQLKQAEAMLAGVAAGGWQRVAAPNGSEPAASAGAARQLIRIETTDAALRGRLQALGLPGGFVACPAPR